MMALEDADAIIAERRYWDPLLHDIDPRLSLNRARVGAEGPGIFPGMWHIIRDGAPDGTVSTAFVISENGFGVPGPYREMGHDILDAIKRGDMWSAQRRHERERDERARALSKERAEANYREARRDDLAVNVKAMMNPGVSLAARGARAKARKK